MKLLIKIVPAVVLFLMLGGSAHAQPKIGTVDLARVFTNYWKTKQADAALQDRRAEMAKEEQKLMGDWQKARDEYQKLVVDSNNQAVSSEERDRRKKAAEDKLREIQTTRETIEQFERQARATLGEQSLRMRDNILGEIRGVINAKAKAGNFTYVVDVSAQSGDRTPVILYTAGEHDLTDSVIAQLNAGEPLNLSTPDTRKEEPRGATPPRR